MVFEVEEVDETGALTATYLTSNTSTRIDVVKPKRDESIWSRLLAVFLPAGYPHSVTSDYIQYQIYDSLQAFSSSIAGLLSSRAVLEGVGVGDSSASPTSALLLSILQESMGRVATILFAHRLGTSLEPECKMYRLAADVFNDAAMVLDCLSPVLPRAPRVLLLGVSSVLRALCGVAAGSSKASLSAHFAKWGNLGELNAKDSSQETVISLLGMLAGSVAVSLISTPVATWTCLITLLSVHLAMNRAAVRAVSMHSLNRQRANIVFSVFWDENRILIPEEVSQQERIFEWDGVLRWKDSPPLAKARIGVPLQSLLGSFSPAHAVTSSTRGASPELEKLFHMFDHEMYLLWYDSTYQVARLVMKENSTPTALLKAWANALLLAHRLERRLATSASATDVLDELSSTLTDLNGRWPTFVDQISSAGWDIGMVNLETASGTRLRLYSENNSRGKT